MTSLAQLADLLETHNRGGNLIGPLDRPTIESQLIEDALLPARVVPPQGRFVDVGSGAGLPGLVIAAEFPEVEVHLVEPRQKRTTFLGIAIRRLKLDNVQVHRCRLEELDVSLALFDIAAAKAFRPPAQWVEAAGPLVTTTGHVWVYATVATWTEDVVAQVASLGFVEQGRCQHPSDCRRFGIVLRRASHTTSTS